MRKCAQRLKRSKLIDSNDAWSRCKGAYRSNCNAAISHLGSATNECWPNFFCVQISLLMWSKSDSESCWTGQRLFVFPTSLRQPHSFVLSCGPVPLSGLRDCSGLGSIEDYVQGSGVLSCGVIHPWLAKQLAAVIHINWEDGKSFTSVQEHFIIPQCIHLKIYAVYFIIILRRFCLELFWYKCCWWQH